MGSTLTSWWRPVTAESLGRARLAEVWVRARRGVGGHWHGESCPRGRGPVVRAALGDHPLVGAAARCGCKVRCDIEGGTDVRVALGSVAYEVLSVNQGLDRLARYRVGSAQRWVRRGRIEGMVRHCELVAGGALGDALWAWSASVHDRLDEEVAHVAGELVLDLAVLAAGVVPPGQVAPLVWESWRDSVLAGRGEAAAWASVTEAWLSQPGGRLAHAARLAPALWRARGEVARWRVAAGADGVAGRIGPGGDTTSGSRAVVTLDRVGVPPGRRSSARLAFEVREGAQRCWGQGPRVLWVPEASAELAARALGGEVLGVVGPAVAVLFARLWPGVLDAPEALACARAAVE